MNNNDSDFEDNSLSTRAVRKVYFITYSQVDVTKCSDRERFADIILEAFDPRKESSVQPIHWAVCKEQTENTAFFYSLECTKHSADRKYCFLIC